MPFIPFVKADGSPIDAVRAEDALDRSVNPDRLLVAPEHLKTAQLVIRNQLMEALLDHLLGKPNNDQAQYEAEHVMLEYWAVLIHQGGIRW
jgi:hypothetical protein